MVDTDTSRPDAPRFARRVVEYAAEASPYSGAILGDLTESFCSRWQTSPRNARRWYRRQALAMLLRFGPRRALPQNLRADIVYACRGMLRAPVMAMIAAITLAVGIGANIAILSIVDAMYFRPVAVARPQELVAVTAGDRRAPGRVSSAGTSIADFDQIRRTLRGVSDVAAYAMVDLAVGDSVGMEPMRTALVTGNYFRALGIVPQRGRFIQPDEETLIGAHPVAVISDHFWRERYQSGEVVGHLLDVGGKPFTIIGVAPPHFTGLHPEGRTDLWLPYTMSDALDAAEPGASGVRTLSVFARRLANTTIAEVQGSADAVSRRLRDEASISDSTIALQVHSREHLADFGMNSGVMLLGMVWLVVGMLHLALCMNVASLMLARITTRRVEFGIRLCLGASRGHIVQQGVVEASAMALPGALVGLALGWALVQTITRMQFLSAAEFLFDGRAVALVGTVSVLTVLQFGLLPALDASRTDPSGMLRDGASSFRGARRLEIVSVVQVAVAVVLLTNGVAFATLFHRQQASPAGFDVDHTLVIATPVPPRISNAAWRHYTIRQ